MSRIVYSIIFLALFSSFSANAQEKGGVSVHVPARLALLISKTSKPESDDEALPSKEPVKKKVGAKLAKGDDFKPNLAKSTTAEIKEVRMAVATERKKAHEIPGKVEPIPTKVTDTKPAKGKVVKEKLATEEEREKHHSASGTSGGGRFAGKGFRVQIYNGTSREEALRRKAEFMRNYPGVHTYLVFLSPHYKLKVGDYRRREDAIGMFHEANGTYSPCMIVPDMVAIHTD